MLKPGTRLIRVSDLEWLEPIAKKHGEWSSLLWAMDNQKFSVVEPPNAMMMIYQDGHGYALAGLSDRPKPLLRVVEGILEVALRMKLQLHGHWKPGSWQARVADKFFFELQPSGIYTWTLVEQPNVF